uniref:Uncharacterized protein n=1 Tax=Meloidogyne hapla TaxID=6305 RepID=A0A1I8B369_MELHA
MNANMLPAGLTLSGKLSSRKKLAKVAGCSSNDEHNNTKNSMEIDYNSEDSEMDDSIGYERDENGGDSLSMSSLGEDNELIEKEEENNQKIQIKENPIQNVGFNGIANLLGLIHQKQQQNNNSDPILPTTLSHINSLPFPPNLHPMQILMLMQTAAAHHALLQQRQQQQQIQQTLINGQNETPSSTSEHSPTSTSSSPTQKISENNGSKLGKKPQKKKSGNGPKTKPFKLSIDQILGQKTSGFL